MKKLKIYLTEYTVSSEKEKDEEDLIFAGITILAENVDDAYRELERSGLNGFRIINA